MRTTLKSILVCLSWQAALLFSLVGTASAQALYTNPDTIQKYLKDRIAEKLGMLDACVDELLSHVTEPEGDLKAGAGALTQILRDAFLASMRRQLTDGAFDPDSFRGEMYRLADIVRSA